MENRAEIYLFNVDRTSAIVDPASIAQAVFNRKGTLAAWNPPFAAKFTTRELRAHRSIFDFLPQVGAALWAEIWARLEAGASVAFRLRDHAAPEKTCDIFVNPILSAAGLSASVELRDTCDATNRQLLQRLQHDILEAVATGWPLPRIIDFVCRGAEALAPNVICSVLTADLDVGRLDLLSGPSLPAQYANALSGIPIGPGMGSCGTTAYLGKPIETTDIENDPLWADYKHLALPFGFRACWSSPIIGRNGNVTGTFAFYYYTMRGPDALDRQIVEACTHLCAIAIEHENAQSRILKLAFRDQLTDLPNRAAFQHRASEILSLLPEPEQSLAVHYIDLDDFKGVNDTLGHLFGDNLLRVVATRFQSICENNEFIARLGGDEFAILQFPVTAPGQIDWLARRILSCFERPFEIEDRIISINASIGISQAAADSSNFTDLLKRADVALYHAKSAGRATYRLFDEEMDRRILARRAMERDLRQALANDEIEVHFQPVVHLCSGRTNCFEALVRWTHPTRGEVPPAEFIPIAEEIGMIGALGDWILRQACAQAMTWPPEVKVAVNLSPLQLNRQTFALDVASILAASGLPPGRLELEITESVPLIENAAMREMLNDLKRLGVAIALDDFGTGYSSLSYLRSFPFDRIKIDLSFIHDMQEHEQSMSIVKAVLDLARSLDVWTTAEGIETEHQRIWLQAQGCSEGQGFLFGRALKAAQVVSFLTGEKTHAAARHDLKRA